MRADAFRNRLKLVNACRDVVAEYGTTAVVVKQITARAGVSPATFFRHFESKDALIDEVSVSRWALLEQFSRTGVRPGDPHLRHVVGILEAFTRMINSDEGFIDATGLRIGQTPGAIRPIRGAFEANFATLWRDCQRQGMIRPAAHPRDAMDMTGGIRNRERRLQMLTTLVTGLCTDAVDTEALIREMFPEPLPLQSLWRTSA